jgi:hypothetical protein
MQLSALKPFVPAGKDYALSKQFFRDLGFTVNWESPGMTELQLGSAVFILQDFDNIVLQENLMFFVGVDDLDAWWQHIRDTGVLERYPDARGQAPADYPWGQREVHLIDIAGVCWHFG